MKKQKLKLFEYVVSRVSSRLSHRQLMYVLSLIIGLASGMAAIILKNLAHITTQFVRAQAEGSQINFLYLAFPFLGVVFTILFVKLVVKDEMGHGVTKVLYSLSKRGGYIRPHNNYSSIIASTLTVGFGGSVGLESPVVVTGSSIGSTMGRFFGMNYKSVMTLIGCGAAGAIAGIFKAPIAGVLFALEVLMLDISIWSMIPLLISAVSGASLSYFLIGPQATLHFPVEGKFIISNIPYYILLGLIAGLISLYFTRSTIKIESIFAGFRNTWTKVIAGGIALGLLIFMFPPLYGEGYDMLNNLLDGNIDAVMRGSLFYGSSGMLPIVIVFMFLTLMFKPVAMTATTGSGGVGGIFAPTLFMGGFMGFIMVKLLNTVSFIRIPEPNFILAGMAGLMAGVMHAPLTAIFLIAEVTGGYNLFIPLMITSTISFMTIKYFEPHSIYTHRLAKRGELLTHNKDKAILTLLEMDKVIERDFTEVSPDDTLGEMVKAISRSKRNLFPVVINNRMLVGIVLLDDIRHIMFNQELYSGIFVRDLMHPPPAYISPSDSMESVMKKFEDNEAWNLPVINNGAYIGFLSKSKLFSYYRNLLLEISDE